MSIEPEHDEFGNTYAKIDKMTDADKKRFSDAFPEFFTRLEQEKKQKQQLKQSIMHRTVFPDLTTSNYDNDIHNSLKFGESYTWNITVPQFKIVTTKKKRTRKKLPKKEYTIKVIDLKRQVGVEGKAVVDPNKIRNKRVGRKPTSKEELERIKRELEKQKKKEDREKNKKKKYDNVLNVF